MKLAGAIAALFGLILLLCLWRADCERREFERLDRATMEAWGYSARPHQSAPITEAEASEPWQEPTPLPQP